MNPIHITIKTITLSSLLLLLFLAVSCRKQLDLEPHKIYYENFYQTPEDAVSAINAVYDVLGQMNMYNGSLWLIQDIGSDDCNARPTLNDPNLREFQSYSIGANNNYIAGVWQESYLGISRANIVLEKVPPISMDSALKERILGEAYFLRGLFYFNLVRFFGDVPLVLKPTSANLTDEELYPHRMAFVKIYEQIVTDLSMAADRLPASYSSGADKGRATRGAANGILAKVYLTQQNWEAARNAAQTVMESGAYSIWPDYTDNFKEAKKNGIESVFEVQFYKKVTSENSRIVISGLPLLPAVFPAGVGIMTPTTDLLASFEEGDYRYEATFFDSYWNYTFDPHIWKHWDQSAYDPDETSQSGADFMVMRYAEILLIFAEAENELSGPTTLAYDAINLVRARARNNDPAVLPDLQGLSQDQFRAAVLVERRHEFVNEGLRWYDLTRTNNLVEFVKRAKGDQANPQSFNYLFPIPQRERDLNANLTQNTGY
ncbi:MAG: RagB/SusD family nutrient uptake outer membrane protein [Bacteroidales bacterium]|nr:RagB/SusD family nutrient uptake outer membrane protein [Bacteroidales bacterium]